MSVGIQVSPAGAAKPTGTDLTSPGQGGKINVSSHNHLQMANQDMSMSGKSLHNLTGMYGVRS